MMAVRPGTSPERLPDKSPSRARRKLPAINLPMTRPPKPASHLPLTSGMTEPSIRGSSSGCGILSHRSRIPIRCTPEWKMRRCFARPMAEKTGKNSPACAATALAPNGSRAQAACACTLLCSIPAIRSACGLRFRRQVRSALTMAAQNWKPINKGLRSQYIPDPNAEVGHCVHHIAMNPKRPGVLFMQKHWDVMRSDNAGDEWKEVSGNLPTDFGFAIDVHSHEPETIYVVPIKSDSEHFVHDGKLRVFRSRSGGNEWEAANQRPAAERLLR